MKYTWTAEFTVDETGQRTATRSGRSGAGHDRESWSYAYSNEVTGKVIKAQHRVEILKAQNQ